MTFACMSTRCVCQGRQMPAAGSNQMPLSAEYWAWLPAD